jgi:hypothetical protein
MNNMRAVWLLGLVALFGGTAAADSLTIDLPLVNGIPTLTGTAGQALVVNAIIGVDPADANLFLENLSIDETSVQGTGVVGYNTDVFFNYPTNPIAGILPAGNTEGGLVTISFPTLDAETITQVFYNVTYSASDTPFTGFFYVVDEPPGVPEPSTFALMGLALSVAAVFQRRRTSRQRAARPDTPSAA